ncbi:hypothetical protein [Streptomyces sp. NPDC093094]|uniref:hypothetical protein n=1 Tax=Streptomyces sp. NPDC093094 TaxID=3366026 RepID=UPI00380A1EFD
MVDARARAAVAGAVAVLGWQAAGTAQADEHHTASHNGHRVALVSVGQVDDPMEDVLEHVLLVGPGKLGG